MKPARTPNELPFKCMIIWMFAPLLIWTALAFPVARLPLSDAALLAWLGIWVFSYLAVMGFPVYFDRVIFPEGIQIRFFGKPVRHIPASDFKILCAVGDGRQHYLCLSGWNVEELAQHRERILEKGIFTRHELPFIKEKAGWEERLAREYLLKPRQVLRDPILWLPFDPVLVIYMRRMYPQLPYVDLRSDRQEKFSMYDSNQIPLTSYRYRLDETGIHVLNELGKNELRCFQPQQIKTIFRLDRFANMSKTESGHVRYLVVSELELGELAQRGKKKGWEKWKKQIVEQMPEAEEMFAAEFHFSGFFTWNCRKATDCHFEHTPELEKQLRQLCPHARWVDYSQKWQNQ